VGAGNPLAPDIPRPIRSCQSLRVQQLHFQVSQASSANEQDSHSWLRLNLWLMESQAQAVFAHTHFGTSTKNRMNRDYFAYAKMRLNR
jgi:hypothetical protein